MLWWLADPSRTGHAMIALPFRRPFDQARARMGHGAVVSNLTNATTDPAGWSRLALGIREGRMRSYQALQPSEPTAQAASVHQYRMSAQLNAALLPERRGGRQLRVGFGPSSPVFTLRSISRSCTPPPSHTG